MNPSIARLLGAAALALGSASPSHATAVIDFDPIDLVGLYAAGESFTQAGYQMTAQMDFGTVDFAAALGAVAPSGNATQFYFAANSGSLRVAPLDSVPFRLNGFSAAFVPLDPPSLQTTVIVAKGTTVADVEVIASWAFGSSVTSSFPFTAYAAAPAFDNLKRVEFYACSLVGSLICTQPTLNNGQFAIDNISVTAVPEPGTALLLTLGVLGLGLRARRSQR
jgi:PEP-CTERM motif